MEIEVDGTIYTATTDENGSYVIEDVPIGTHSMMVSKDDMEETITITVEENETADAPAITLEQDPATYEIPSWLWILIIFIIVMIVVGMVAMRMRQKGKTKQADMDQDLEHKDEPLDPGPPPGEAGGGDL